MLATTLSPFGQLTSVCRRNRKLSPVATALNAIGSGALPSG